jgi:hypothetical protein
MRTRRRSWAWPALVLILGTAADVAACPNCKEAVANQQGGDAQRLADGYSYSILLMMAMPFTLLGTGAFLIARAVKRGSLPDL